MKRKKNREKLEPKMEKCGYVTHMENVKCYLCWHRNHHNHQSVRPAKERRKIIIIHDINNIEYGKSHAYYIFLIWIVCLG